MFAAQFSDNTKLNTLLWGMILLTSYPVMLFSQTIPRLDWGTYHGGNAIDASRDIAMDDLGFLYILGSSESNNGVSLPGGHQENNAGSFDAFLAKYDQEGNRLWATYFGGPGDEYGQSVDVDNEGNVYITGSTNSTEGIATTGSYQTTFGGGATDAFIAKFDIDGDLVWATYMGSDGYEITNSIAADDQGNVFIIGWTNSADGLTTSNAFSPDYNGGNHDAFLARMDDEGGINWITYLGGSGDDTGLQVRINPGGDLVVSGWTSSTNNIATANAYQTTYGGGTADVFLALFQIDGSRIWSTYYGGSEDEYADALEVAASGDIYIAGPCTSPNALSSASAHQPVIGGGFDAFIARFSSEGERIWGSYYGGASNDVAYALTLDNMGSIYMAGHTMSTDGIATVNAHQTENGGGSDAYLVRFTEDGVREWASYYGGDGEEQAFGMEVDENDRIYITGNTGSSGQISTPGAFQENFGGGMQDAYLARFSPCEDPVAELTNGGYICEPSDVVMELILTGTPPFTITYSVDGVERPPVTAESSPFFLTVELPWTDSIKILSVSSGDCEGIITGQFDLIQIPSEIDLGIPMFDCNDMDTTYTVVLEMSGGVFNYLSVGNTEGTISGNVFTSVPIPYDDPFDIEITTTLDCEPFSISGFSDCTLPCPEDFGEITGNTTVCAGDMIQITASGGVIYEWIGPNNFFSDSPTITFENATAQQQGQYVVFIIDEDNCEDAIEFTITVREFEGTVSPVDPICEGEDLVLMASGGTTYSWEGPEGFTSEEPNPVISPATPENTGAYTVTITDDIGCPGELTVDIVIHSAPEISLTSNSPVCEGEEILIETMGEAESFSWTGPDGFTSTERNISILQAMSVQSGIYHVEAMNIEMCIANDSIEIDILEMPVASIEGDEEVCLGLPVTLIASGGSAFVWSTGSEEAQITVSPTENTTYSVEVFNGQCSDMVQWTVAVRPSPIIETSGDASISLGGSVRLIASGADEFLWFPFQDLSCTACPDPIASPTITTEYCVTGETDGCSSDVCLTVFVSEECDITLPNVFSPNGDGVNDEWCSLPSECVLFQRLTIFDRWGNRIFVQAGDEVCWDGRYSSSEAMQGVYVYTLELTLVDGNNSVYTGDILLMR